MGTAKRTDDAPTRFGEILSWLGTRKKFRDLAEKADFGDPPNPTGDYWSNTFDQIQVAGKGSDLSPHDMALRTFEAEERIDQHLDDKDGGGIWSTTEIIENHQAKFLDEVYDADGKTKEGVDTTWGLDLRRKGLDDIEDVRSPEYYETLTKGEVDWASYQNSVAYKAAFQVLLEKNPTIYADWDKDPGEKLEFNIDKLGKDVKASTDLVRHVNQGLYKDFIKADNDGWKRHWEGKYDGDNIVKSADGDLYIDGERQIGLTERYSRKKGDINPDTGKAWTAQERGRLFDAEDAYSWKADNIVGPKTPVVKPDALKIENIRANKVHVKRPANIPASWGAV